MSWSTLILVNVLASEDPLISLRCNKLSMNTNYLNAPAGTLPLPWELQACGIKYHVFLIQYNVYETHT